MKDNLGHVNGANGVQEAGQNGVSMGWHKSENVVMLIRVREYKVP